MIDWMGKYKIDAAHNFYKIERIELEIENYININNIINKDNIKSLFKLIIKGNDKEINQYILYKNKDINNKTDMVNLFNNKDENKKNIFHPMFKNNCIYTYKYISLLIKNDKNLIKELLLEKQLKNNKSTPIYCALNYGCIDILKMLMIEFPTILSSYYYEKYFFFI